MRKVAILPGGMNADRNAAWNVQNKILEASRIVKVEIFTTVCLRLLCWCSAELQLVKEQQQLQRGD